MGFWSGVAGGSYVLELSLVCVFLGFCAGVVLGFCALWFGVSTRVKMVRASQKAAFECGFDALSNSWAPFTLRFFILAMIFLVLDVEMVLFFSVVYSKGVYLMEVSALMKLLLLVFLALLFVGLVHEENEGGLE